MKLLAREDWSNAGCTSFAYVFKPGKTINNDYWGCSGAPIIDSNGKIIALVLGRHNQEIYGVQINTKLNELLLNLNDIIIRDMNKINELKGHNT